MCSFWGGWGVLELGFAVFGPFFGWRFFFWGSQAYPLSSAHLQVVVFKQVSSLELVGSLVFLFLGLRFCLFWDGVGPGR